MLAGLAGGLCMLMAGSALAFSLDDVAKRAQELAASGYEEPVSNLPDEFRKMAFADYQRVRFNPEHAYWKDVETPFHLQFYHQGMHFDTPVRINEITATKVREIATTRLCSSSAASTLIRPRWSWASPASRCSIR